MKSGQQQISTTFWGKLKQGPAQIPDYFLPLSHHCLDVAVVFRQLVDLRAIQRCLRTAANTTLTSVHLDRLAVLALLHDFGKANLGFQDIEVTWETVLLMKVMMLHWQST